MPTYLNAPDQSPQGGNGRFMVAMLIICLVMVFLPYLFGTPQKAEEAQKAAAEAQKLEAEQQPNAPAIGVAYKIETRTIETNEYKLVMTNAGGGRASEFFLKIPDRYAEHGENGDYIRSQKPEKADFGGLLPFKMTLPSFRINGETQFQLTSPEADHDKVTLHYETPDGTLAVNKTFSKTETPYVIRAEVEVINKSNQPIEDILTTELAIKQIEGEEPGLFTPGSYVAAKCYADESLEYLDATDKDEEETYRKKIGWSAVDESYFAIAINYNDPNENGDPAKLKSKTCTISNDGEVLRSQLGIPLMLSANSTEKLSYDIYMGPKENDYLQNFGHDLGNIIDYGWIEVLAKPMTWVLAKFESFLGNWGLAIMLLTLIVRLCLWPIAQKGQLSMMSMSKLTPKMQELQKQYKDDPQTMAQKQQELYKEMNVNPAAGCLPLLIQMPIFFALYRCIFVTGGLYHAPFYFWIHDLSAPDPYFILPIIIIALMFVPMLLNANGSMSNPQTRVMTIVMPIMFGVMMLFLPSGLCLYMVVSSTVSCIQTLYVRRLAARMDLLPKPAEKKATVDV